ncbi:MAG: hypothetical protein K9J17_14095 [Flavobacteriales bacterium]|nr:hypothetical protein [Flavobacteriales bacterium]
MKLTSINTIEDVKEFVHILIEEEELNFHPDTPFEDYVFINSGEPFYSAEEVEVRNRLLNQVFELGERLEIDTHESMCRTGLKMFNKTYEL